MDSIEFEGCTICEKYPVHINDLLIGYFIKITVDDIVEHNKFLGNVYVINVIESHEKRNQVIKELKKLNIKNITFLCVKLFKKIGNLKDEEFRKKLKDYVVFENKIYEKVAYGDIGCTLSFLLCMRDAVSHKYDKVFFVEDDLRFHEDRNLEIVMNEINNFVSSEDFDLLLLHTEKRAIKLINKYKTYDYIFSLHSPNFMSHDLVMNKDLIEYFGNYIFNVTACNQGTDDLLMQIVNSKKYFCIFPSVTYQYGISETHGKFVIRNTP
jgi:hypothetical protein